MRLRSSSLKSNREDTVLTVNTQVTGESEEQEVKSSNVDFLRGCVYDEGDERYKQLEAERMA